MGRDVRQTASAQGVAFVAAERLFAPGGGGRLAPRLRFAAVLALCLLAHALIVAFLLHEDTASNPFAGAQTQEIPVEIIVEPPPEPKVEAPPEPPAPEPSEPKLKEKPPQVTTDEKPAFDAPRAAGKEQAEREAPERETKAPQLAPPPEQVTPKQEPPQALKDGQENAIGVEPEAAPMTPADDKPEAEVIEKAEPVLKPQEKPDSKQAKPAAKQGEAKSIADQLAALAPLPEVQLDASAKPSPVGGGSAKTTYLSILYGLIVPHMHVPAHVRGNHAVGNGVVAFYIDERGNLTHHAVYRTSGAPDLDVAALVAVKRAAPFPAPPPGLPHSILFTYVPK